jgi:predicted nucleic acid-binding protein
MLEEPQSARMRRLLAQDGAIATSSITPIEITSVLWRQRHAGRLHVAAHHDVDVTFAELSARWNEVAHTEIVFQTALDVVTRHPLRTLDAMQLPAAIVMSDSPSHIAFVTLDKNLAAAARAEGFPVIP